MSQNRSKGLTCALVSEKGICMKKLNTCCGHFVYQIWTIYVISFLYHGIHSDKLDLWSLLECSSLRPMPHASSKFYICICKLWHISKLGSIRTWPSNECQTSAWVTRDTCNFSVNLWLFRTFCFRVRVSHRTDRQTDELQCIMRPSIAIAT